MAENLFVGGDLSVLLRSHDWSQTPLGAIETWSDSLITAVEILLAEIERAKPLEKTQHNCDLLQKHTCWDALPQATQADAFRVLLANALRPLTDAVEIQVTAARVLGDFLGANRVIYIEVLPSGKEVIVHQNYTNGVAQLSGLYSLEEFGRNLTDDHRAGQTAVVPNVANSLKYTESEKAMYEEIDIAAHIDVPLLKNDRFVALLAVHQATPRQWTKDEVKRIEETAEQTWAAVERARAESALRQSEARFRTLISASSNVLYRMNADWSEMHELQGGNFIADTSEPIHDWLQKYIYPDDQARVLETIAAAIQNKHLFELEHRVRQADGTLGWTYSRAVPLLNSAGKIIEWFGEASDISERKRIEQEREQLLQQEQAARKAAENANRIKDEFLAVLSHELRSPLNPILGWTRLLQKGNLDANRQAEALKTIERNAKLQTQLIEDLLDISGILQGKLSLTVTPVSLNFVISLALETICLAAEAKNITIALDLGSATALVSGDAVRLQQVVGNLLSNAVKFTHPGGKVKVRLTCVGTDAQITVSDTGKGIEPDFLPCIFEYFRQEDASTTRKFGGLGLGLAIARQLVELHGGTIAADSPGVGQGATFTVRIPLASQSSATPDLNQLSEPAFSLNGMKILVVDDDADSRELLSFVLEQENALVTVASSAIEALHVIERSMPNLVISDIGMPEIDGYILMQQIRKIPRSKHIPAIALSAYAGEVGRQQAEAAGFGLHLAKPVEPAQLLEAISNLIKDNQ